MERSWIYRILLYCLVTVVAGVALVPSVATWAGKEDALPAWFHKSFSRKILLGLDLQGGLHMVYKVDVDKAVEHKADRLASDLEDRLQKESKIPASAYSLRRSGRDEITIKFNDPENVKKIDHGFMKSFRRDLDEVTKDANKGEVAFKVSPDQIDEMREYALRQGVETIRNRVDSLGVSEPAIIRKGENIIVELPGLKGESLDRVKDRIGQTAQLEFKIVDDGSDYMQRKILGLAQALASKYPGLQVEHDAWTQKDNGAQHTDVYLRAPERETLEKFFAELPPEDQVPADHEIGYEQEVARDDLGQPTGEKYWRTYYLHRRAQITGEYLADADWGADQQTMRPEVNLSFDRRGADLFEQVSGGNVGRKMAIILDGKINSAPVLESKIGGGRARITLGGMTSPDAMREEAKDLVAVLKSGALPAPLVKQSESFVGPTLGKDAVHKAKLSMIVGSLLVVMFMLLYYRGAGIIANVAMILNVLYLLAILAFLQATLTLPGIAGVVLTVGMAVDANIIIYERIREELRAGKTARGAVDTGFDRAFWTVVDAHVTNLVAGIVLLSYGTGPVRGFAATLIAGIICNLFTSVWMSHSMFDFMVARRSKSATLSI